MDLRERTICGIAQGARDAKPSNTASGQAWYALPRVAMPLAAFAFMGGDGVGTALGGHVIKATGFTLFFGAYVLALAVLVVLALAVVRDMAGHVERQKPSG